MIITYLIPSTSLTCWTKPGDTAGLLAALTPAAAAPWWTPAAAGLGAAPRACVARRSSRCELQFGIGQRGGGVQDAGRAEIKSSTKAASAPFPSSLPGAASAQFALGSSSVCHQSLYGRCMMIEGRERCVCAGCGGLPPLFFRRAQSAAAARVGTRRGCVSANAPGRRQTDNTHRPSLSTAVGSGCLKPKLHV